MFQALKKEVKFLVDQKNGMEFYGKLDNQLQARSLLVPKMTTLGVYL